MFWIKYLKDEMYILGIDTATKFLSVVVARDKHVLAGYNRIQERAHSRLLVPVIEKVLRKAQLSLREIDYLSVDRGPGSFTGIRIGLATIKGLSMALGKPVVGFSGLDVLAFNLVKNEHSLICPLIDAKRGQVYSALYKSTKGKLRRLSGYFLGALEEIMNKTKGRVVFTGDAVPFYRQQIQRLRGDEVVFAAEKYWYPNSFSLIQVSFEEYKKQKFYNADELSPLYLYPDTCTVRASRE